jgi:deoxycytidylate deaminase
MTQEHIDKGCKLALEEASKSYCKKRKVGAVILDFYGNHICSGHNYLPIIQLAGPSACEDTYGNTLPDVIHAEIATIQSIDSQKFNECTIFVTHQPCENCLKAIKDAGLQMHLVEQFMKFDTGKLRYSLIPPEATKALASVLMYGAKKYKAHNWKQADDFDRYVDALYRHLEAWRSGHKFDEESGLSHLSHALANVAFLIWDEAHKVRVDSRSDQNID